MNQTPKLSEYVPLFDSPDSYVTSRGNLVPAQRMRNIYRNHKAILAEVGATIFVGGRLYCHPQILDELLLAMFRADAIARASIGKSKSEKEADMADAIRKALIV